MRVLAVVHQDDAGPGVFAEAAAARGDDLVTWSPADGPPPVVNGNGFSAVVVLGGAAHADQDDLHPWLGPEKRFLSDLIERDVPILGVCLGAQLVAQAAGARVSRRDEPEIGWHDVELTAAGRGDPVMAVAPPSFSAFEWHSYECELPPGGTALARNGACLQAFRVRAAWGIQFHAEVTREIALGWLSNHEHDEDAVRVGLDPAPIAERTEKEIDGWNALGRDLCTRFLARAERRRRQAR